jgi:isoquinoline 1-oxidoreductase
MLYAKVLRPPSYGAVLDSVDLSPAKAMENVVAFQEDQFVGVAAPTTFLARQALEVLETAAKWKTNPHPSSKEVHQYLMEHARGGIPKNGFTQQIESAKQVLRQEYRSAYVQHAPLEPRAAVAEWDSEGKLTVWTGTQNPFGHRDELARAFNIPAGKVRVIVPDFGSGFGGKHTAEAAIEAARLAKACKRPVSLRWTREEEFTWAYFRPAAVIRIEASLDEKGSLTSWHYININSGGAAIDTPYEAGRKECKFVQSDAPLRQGSYRALAAPVNTFARECFMDELAVAAGKDPLDFRLAHLKNERLRAVLETAAQRFGWSEKSAKKSASRGVGLACGTEKGSFVATCVEIEIGAQDVIRVRKVCEVFECGPALNPSNLMSQVEGQIMMALGPALWEEMTFEGGKMLNATFRRYRVPRLSDIPELDIHFLSRPDLDSAGGGETPFIAVAPAIANAVFHARGIRLRSLPLRIH